MINPVFKLSSLMPEILPIPDLNNNYEKQEIENLLICLSFSSISCFSLSNLRVSISSFFCLFPISSWLNLQNCPNLQYLHQKKFL